MKKHRIECLGGLRKYYKKNWLEVESASSAKRSRWNWSAPERTCSARSSGNCSDACVTEALQS